MHIYISKQTDKVRQTDRRTNRRKIRVVSDKAREKEDKYRCSETTVVRVWQYNLRALKR